VNAQWNELCEVPLWREAVLWRTLYQRVRHAVVRSDVQIAYRLLALSLYHVTTASSLTSSSAAASTSFQCSDWPPSYEPTSKKFTSFAWISKIKIRRLRTAWAIAPFVYCGNKSRQRSVQKLSVLCTATSHSVNWLGLLLISYSIITH